MTDTNDLQAALADIVGTTGLIADDAGKERFVTEWRGLWHGQCDVVVRPGSTDEMSRVIATCHGAGVAVVPQSGNTGLVGGGVPDGGVVVSTERLNAIREVDPVNFTLTAEAGCILADVQTAAADVDRLFPLSLAAEGSCRIGGNLSTNAGGVQVLRYGNARDLVLGLEVVLPDGRVWEGLRSLRKDNTGYDLKHLFMGAEGTLGIITAAVLKLYPKPRQVETAFIGLKDVAAVIELFDRMNSNAGDALSAFEMMNRLSMKMAVDHVPDNRDPLADAHPAYVLMELTSPRPGTGMRAALESVLEMAFEDGIVSDAAFAESQGQAADFWRIRETIPEAQGQAGGSIKSDVAVPVSSVASLLPRLDAKVEAIVPGCRPVAFGHIGDGNIHYNVSQPEGMDTDAFMARWHDLTDAINDIVFALGGSFSAEHGIGQLKREELKRYRPDVEVDIMRTLKSALDPKGIMNPGKVL